MITPSKKAQDAVNSFKLLETFKLFQNSGHTSDMHVFMPRLNGRSFDIESIQENLLELVVDFALSRKTVTKYIENEQFAKMSQEARSRFKDFITNTGELGELILYTFLEGHLGAPQILSKMSLKTNSQDYTKGSDGIHLLRLQQDALQVKYHLIFGESKTYKNIMSAFRNAFASIFEHQEAKKFERSLINSQIDSEFIDEEHKQIIRDVLYPSKSKRVAKVSDAFGIFIGFEIDDSQFKELSEDDYEHRVELQIKDTVRSKISTIEDYIKQTRQGKDGATGNLLDKNFYVYIMPFTELDATRKKITKGITE